MECPICGHPLGENDTFCENCGSFSLPLQSDAGRPSVIPVPDGVSAESPAPEDLDGNTAKPEPRKVAQRLYPPPDVELEDDPENAIESDAPATSEESPETEAGLSKHTAKKKRPLSHTQAKKRLRRMTIITTAACILAAIAIGAAVYIVANTAYLRVQLSKAQKESSTAQANAADLVTQVTELTDSLAATEAENQSLGAQVADLQSQINSMESSVNQNQYDKDSALRDLDAANAQLASATEENETLRDQLATAQSDLETCQADLEEAQADNEALTEENESLSSQVEEMETKVDFYDTYVVFVNQGTTDRYYHKYSCPDFSRQQFVAYSPKLAESNGYHPCPVCCGGTELPEQTTGIFGGLFG